MRLVSFRELRHSCPVLASQHQSSPLKPRSVIPQCKGLRKCDKYYVANKHGDFQTVGLTLLVYDFVEQSAEITGKKLTRIFQQLSQPSQVCCLSLLYNFHSRPNRPRCAAYLFYTTFTAIPGVLLISFIQLSQSSQSSQVIEKLPS